jgi:hypothetical protein
MIRTMLAATTLALLATTGPAAAVATGPGAKARTKLTVSYTADAGFASAVVLSCDPVAGAHPAGAQACAVLKKVDGRPAKLRPAPAMCTLEYAPITARITGTWKGSTVKWSKKFGNRCDLTRTTGALFSF